MSESEMLHPDVVPDRSEIEVANAPFVAACIASIADHVERCGLRFGDSILTKHHHWGLVWRVDILRQHETARSATVRRYICWRPPDMDDDIGGTASVYAKKEDRLR